MDTTLILKNVAKHISLDEDEKDHFQSIVAEREFSRNEFIFQAGGKCQSIYFVNDGALRAYHINQEGKESTVMFATKDWWITDMNGFINNLPSSMYLKCLKKSSVLELKNGAYNKLLEQHPKFERFFRVLMQNAYIREQNRTIQNLSMTAEERYQWFIAKYPDLLSLVTLKQIASYLGITPEFLSVIRAKRT